MSEWPHLVPGLLAFWVNGLDYDWAQPLSLAAVPRHRKSFLYV
ncbi:hypothetical protein V6245_02040 [Salinibacterium amurskyense]